MGGIQYSNYSNRTIHQRMESAESDEDIDHG